MLLGDFHCCIEKYSSHLVTLLPPCPQQLTPRGFENMFDLYLNCFLQTKMEAPTVINIIWRLQ